MAYPVYRAYLQPESIAISSTLAFQFGGGHFPQSVTPRVDHEVSPSWCRPSKHPCQVSAALVSPSLFCHRHTHVTTAAEAIKASCPHLAGASHPALWHHPTRQPCSRPDAPPCPGAHLAHGRRRRHRHAADHVAPKIFPLCLAGILLQHMHCFPPQCTPVAHACARSQGTAGGLQSSQPMRKAPDARINRAASLLSTCFLRLLRQPAHRDLRAAERDALPSR